MVETQPHNNPAPGFGAVNSVFVGRQREMGELQATLDGGLSGQGCLVMLGGEPGIGKTRTAQELASYAESKGARAFWGRCYEGEGAPPYWPWVQLLRQYIEQKDHAEVKCEIGAGASDLFGILPELGQIFPDLKNPPALEPEQSRFRLFNSVSTFLKNASLKEPLLFVLDDVQWADRSSLLLLQYVAQQMRDSRLMIIGTYRDIEVGHKHLLHETLAQLSREPVFRRQLLSGLSLDDVEQFVANLTGSRPSRILVSAVHARTEGNPFFTSEVLRLLQARGNLGDETVHDGGTANEIPRGAFQL